MSLIPMVKCTLVARRDDADPVLEALQDVGLVHVVPVAIPVELQTEAGVQPGHEMRQHGDDTDAIRGELERRRHALANVAPSSSRLQITDKSVPEVLTTVDTLLARRDYAQLERDAAEAKMSAVEPFGDVNPEDIAALRKKGVDVRFVAFTREEWDELDRTHLAYAVARQDERRVYAVLFDTDLKDLRPAPAELDLPPERLSELRARHEELGRTIAEVNRELGRYTHYEPTLRRMMDALADRAALLAAIDRSVVAGPLFALEGYLPKENADELKRTLAPFEVALRIDEPAETDHVPVKLRNNWFLQGFEAIVRSFSGVSYREKDFTWAVGILFITFGALCLLDAGYGFLLLLTGLGLSAKGSAFGRVFTITGVFAVLIGALSGQFFGFVIGQHFAMDLVPVVTLSSNPYSCFLFSMVVGMVALLFSYSTAIWQRGWKTAATGSLFLVFAAMAGVFANMANEYVLTVLYSWHQPPADLIASTKVYGNYVAYGFGALALVSWLVFPDPVFGKSAHAGNVAWTLYSGTTGFLQDVLSHMRLFGIALSGSIMALVVNQIGGQFPLPVTIAFAVVGHVFVYLLSLLSLYIHTNRLIFLEYGSKCIDGGTLEYSPLRRRSLA